MGTNFFKMKIPLMLMLLIVGFTLSVQAQNAKNVRGVVTDSAGEPLPGVNIIVKGTTLGTIADFDGNYEINVPGDDAVLVFSYIGHATSEVKVGSRVMVNVVLEEDSKLIEEVVVIGYGTVAKKDVTTAVSVVSLKDLDERPIISAAQAIQGKAAGVNVYQPNGAPGQEIVIRVRGTTSFKGSNDPLYVVDGVPVDNLNFLSPNDIASLQILKDASSAAIYGSRAANGVVLITTKQASAGGAKVAASIQVGVNNVSNQIESLNARQYKELMDELRPGSIPEGITDQTDWFKEVYGTGVTQNYQLQVSDGNEKLRYFVSGGYLDEKGVLSSAFFRRYNLRANIDSQVRKWLNVGLNMSYSDNSSNGVSTGQGSNRGGVVLAVVNLPTASTIKNSEGLYNRTFFGQNITNPIESIENGKNNSNKENRLIASGNMTITFMPELNLKSSFTLDRRNGKETGFTPPVHSSDRDDWGSAWDNRTTNTLLIFDNVLTYKKTFADKHNVEAMVGTSWTDSEWTRSYINGSHFKDASIHTLNAANKIAWNNTGSQAAEWGIMSMFGRLSYNYESKYLLTVNIRRDGSSKLHPDHRWGIFPSASAAWRISAEGFMKDIEWLDDLKLRAGWGQTGNQSGVGDYAYLQRYNIGRQAWFETGKEDALPTITQANLRTSDLTWETTTQTNVGLDITLFKDRLNLVMDYYYKYTTDMLMEVSLPSGAAAANSIVRNEGEMMNRGFELAINSRNLVREFQWNTDFNISFNKNKLEKLELQQIYYDAETTQAFHQTRVVRNEPGRSLGGFYGYISDGVNPETGELMYRDINEDGKITASDKTYIGDPNPTFTYGLTNTFSYKGFSLSLFIQGSVGNDIFNASKGDTQGMYDLKNQSTEVLKRWRTPGQITDVPKAGFNLQPSTYFIEDGSYLRLKDISLSYNFRGGILNKLGVSRLQPYVTARNLLTITKYDGMDPEVNQWGSNGAVQGIDWGTYPHSKSFVFGLNVEF
ncbi:TonB-linked SusC/RagA family outer membrane protein [Parabacteroides sp. PF5-5]|uniref:SusC/RagA family TonB-linked outer membrane protein n=2 Tax=Parabacteroides TaxID=375288 RepID=UPI00247B8324|nr:TonB-linked SusC/RagA family outer membrane protein [Parabacteroides sp. PH5-39]MDH6316278.1 TonB-linked SusC/RagA family outer membrane protein [Parabacteroides sp. PF5-13]MDH6319761.1 TonB-linked SusC/RagA family outer membrane protein [Parabacteroides sp. PH5-13]MDH6323647.1 TonB-linked SusC/RagA family outer membrane protein [Parabacteroides sp. PH5-8]MDH6327465.1 TonB-linked SusC/RagA family outer membrane protein [Parabacteroides sp. PH5-41]MDH6335395.1 TonB-linked SusC/RagA family ou